RVRVVRDELTSFVLGAPVELLGAGDNRNGKTDQTGHVQFDQLKPGVTYKLRATVDGKQVESRPFQAGAEGGLKFMLVGAAAGAPPPEAEAGEEPHAQGESPPAINPHKATPTRTQ